MIKCMIFRIVLITALLWLVPFTAAAQSSPSDNHSPASPPSFSYDNKKAVIFSYSRIGEDNHPHDSLALSDFDAHLRAVETSNYTVWPLEKIVAHLKDGMEIPTRTIALTFDGGHRSFLDYAWPRLKDRGLPVTLFIAPGQVPETSTPQLIGWNDLERLAKEDIITIGLHPARYSNMALWDELTTRTEVNRAKVLIRERLGLTPSLFALPFGMQNAVTHGALEKSGFDAVFGQQSGVAHPGTDLFNIPRFTLSGHFGSVNRFIQTANALPLPVKELETPDPVIDPNQEKVAIGFSLDESLKKDGSSLSCYSNSADKPEISHIGNDRIEIRVLTQTAPERMRLNCILPGPKDPDTDEKRWRWMGFMFHVEHSSHIEN